MTAYLWFIIPAVLILIACAVDKSPAWRRIANKGARRVAR